MEKLIAALTDVASGKAPVARLVASYADGNGLDGFTHITVSGGQVHVGRTRPGQPDDSYDGVLTDAEGRALCSAAVEGKLWTVEPKRKTGVPDETRPAITLGMAGDGDFTVQLWDNEADRVPAFASTRTALLAISARVSRGQVTY